MTYVHSVSNPARPDGTRNAEAWERASERASEGHGRGSGSGMLWPAGDGIAAMRQLIAAIGGWGIGGLGDGGMGN